ncbi:AAA family ATPase [Dolichospermum sp. UHCC 0352]|jgi:predicted ATPase|uniref:AAA family ATPase n=1 Tax=Dolichospermum sp. UHCC 0352 TaxID=2590011 RepID=UPI001445C7BF|nr:AAA family ATPase [Dolichospermum sp. UHCC 0352]MBO1052677.1 AAA family ATPase [Dolichospermum sp. DET73]MTJ22358.1 AAA family ATPase [Dolichospermum sp. UHCC 0352]
MEGKRFIHKIKLQNFLSYGSEGEEIELQPLNVLIGANTSGKSNLIEAIGILRATPTDLPAPFRQGGGINEFLWKGSKDYGTLGAGATIQVMVDYQSGLQTLKYKLEFSEMNQRFFLIDEYIHNDDFVHYSYNDKNLEPVFNFREKDLSGIEKISQENWNKNDLKSDQSILSQLKAARKYPEITYLSDNFNKIRIYRTLSTDINSQLRKHQPTDLPQHPLLEDGSNLGLFIKDLKYRIGNRKIIEKLKKFYEPAEELDVTIYGGTVQIFIREEGVIQPIPATRLSDGTLRYLCLMALLLDPTPPPLICIEEPELGLHPDILPTIAELLIEASQRTQLIVTTHSDALVSALSEYPEAVVVCERDDTGTHLRRLKPDKLKDWLENYTLGDLWRMGEIGGNRW